jgi:hypothetical protein
MKKAPWPSQFEWFMTEFLDPCYVSLTRGSRMPEERSAQPRFAFTGSFAIE